MIAGTELMTEALTAAELTALMAEIRLAALEAGEIALGYFRPGATTAAAIQYKEGGSPVTEADFAVDAFLKARLLQLAPSFGWLSEETEDDPVRLHHSHIWVVDPIDGTRAFARGDSDWTIAIGIAAHGAPLAGVVHAPVTQETFEGARGLGALLNGKTIRASATARLAEARIAGPRPLLDALHASHGPFERAARIHSLAYRFARVADGGVDAGIAEANAHDWDIAAAHAILLESGADIVTSSGLQPSYNRLSTRHEATVAGPKALLSVLVDALKTEHIRRAARLDAARTLD